MTMSNGFFISVAYLSGAAGTSMIIRRLYRLVIQHRSYLADILFTTVEDELPFEPKEEPISFKLSVARISKTMLKSSLYSMLLVMAILSWFDLLLYANRELGLDIQWLSEFHGPRMSILNLSYSEIYQCFSYLHIIVGVAFMLVPLLEIAYFRYEVSKLRPRGRMMTGMECHDITDEISARFHSTSFSLMSTPRKALRRVIFCLGIVLTLSWLAMQVCI